MLLPRFVLGFFRFCLTAKLHVRVPYPGLRHGLVSKVVDTFQKQAAKQEADRHAGLSDFGVQRGKLPLEIFQVHPVRQQDEFVAHVDKIDEQGPEQVPLVLRLLLSQHILQGFDFILHIPLQFRHVFKAHYQH